MTKKYLLKRVSALSLATVLILSVGLNIGGNASVVEAATNEVLNGDFDTDANAIDVNGWTPGAAVAEKVGIDILQTGTFDTSQVFNNLATTKGTVGRTTEGSNQVFYATTNSTDTLTIGKDGLAATTGTEYTITFDLKIPSDAAGKMTVKPFILQRIPGNNISDFATGISSTKNNDWETFSFKCTARENITSWDLRYAISGYAGTCYLDNVKITYPGTEDKIIVTNHAVNGDFSNGVANWALLDSSKGTITEDNGSMKLMATDGAFWVRCTAYIPVAAGTNYSFSYYLKGNSSINTTRVIPYIVSRTATGNGIGNPVSWDGKITNTKPLTAGGTTKSQTAYPYTPAEGTAQVEMRFLINSPDSGAEIWIDDFKFESSKTVYGDGITLNGSDYEMKLSNGNSAVYSGVTLTADKYYDYSFDVTKDATLTKAGLKVGNEIKTEKTGTFKYESGAIGFATEGSGVAYFDNLVISEHTHVGGTATCTAAAVCTKCNQPYGDPIAHPDADNNEVCDVCTADLHQHVMDTEWSSDGTNHYHECTKATCDYKEDSAPCSGGTANCQTEATCSVCHNKYGTKGDHVDENHDEECDICRNNLHVHDMDTAWTSDGTNHWHKCKKTGCEYTEGFAACSGGTATCTEKAKCTVCGKGHGALAAHVYSKQVANETTLKSAATTTAKAVYYKSCVCGKVSTTETFEYGFPLEDTSAKKEDATTTTTTTTPAATTTTTTTTATPKTGDNATRLWLYVAIVAMWTIGLTVKKKES